MAVWKASLEKFTSFILIFFILVSQSVQVSFFDEASARPEDYSDIVSIFVDRETYDATKSKILRYANDIQAYLGSTRVSMHVVSPNISPAQIAALNEKLYYEGDKKTGVSSLVGTVLIGNVPIPMVHMDAKSFPSLYPYVDFRDKYFLWDEATAGYTYSQEVTNPEDVEIWHGVINPAVGRAYETEDITKVSQFLDKTHDFYAREGVFADDRYTLPPRVFYYDGYIEQKSLSYDDIFAYGLLMANAENLVYNRFSKYLLWDMITAQGSYQVSAQSPEEKELYDSLGMDPSGSSYPIDQIESLPDVKTKVMIQKLTKQFYELINSKTLGDIRHMVYNAGRYNNGTEVRVDQPTLHVTATDRVSMLTLREANTTLENAIDAGVTEYARKIAIFDRDTNKKTYAPYGSYGYYGAIYENPENYVGDYIKTYSNYFYGKKASEIRSAAECTIARGSSGTPLTFGRGITVEANNAYALGNTERDLDKLRVDTETLIQLHGSEAYSCFQNDGSIKLDPYWGGNSLLRLSNADMSENAENTFSAPVSTSLTKFADSIYDLTGMRETARISSPSPLDCTNGSYQYALLDPFAYNYRVSLGEDGGWFNCRAGYPEEWNTNSGYCTKDLGDRTPRYTCNTEHQVVSSSIFRDSIVSFPAAECTVGSVKLDGAAILSAANPCITYIQAGEESIPVDKTIYRDLDYHTIPSVVYHKSPTDEELSAAEKGGATPSLAIDMDRYIEFLTPKGNLARFTYPNFFRMEATNVVTARAWLRDLSLRQWNTILVAESSKSLTAAEEKEASYLRPVSPLPSGPIDWNMYVSDEFLAKIIKAKQWLHPDVASKYEASIESSLSFSKNSSAADAAPFVPENPGGYEIAYLGLSRIDPTLETENTELDTSMSLISTGLSRIHSANMTESSVTESPNLGAHKCGSADGVDLFQWFPAILCWLGEVQLPKISAGTCSVNTIGIDNGLATSGLGNPLTPSNEAIASGALMRKYLDGSTLTLALPRNSLNLEDLIALNAYLVKDNSQVLLPLSGEVRYTILTPLDGVRFDPETSPYADGKSSTTFSVKRKAEATTKIQAELTYILPDKTTWTAISAPIEVRIRNEHLSVSPALENVRVGYLDATDARPASISVITERSGELIPSSSSARLDLFDDISGTKVLSGELLTPEYELPFTVTKKTGVYRILVTDSEGRVGETSFTVRPGEASRVSITPTSSLMVSGGKTPVTLSILDKLDNPVITDFYEMEVTIDNGYIVDQDGKKTSKANYILIEGNLALILGSDTPGTMSISVDIKDPLLKSKESIEVIEAAEVVVERSAVPMVGGTPIEVVFKVVNPTTGAILTNFSSPISLDFPEDGGTFSSAIVSIVNGKSQAIKFIPGKKSGNHTLSLDIPGMGPSKKAIFSLDPGIPMRLGLSKEDTDIRATLLDRFGNISPLSPSGTWRYNAESSQSFSFVEGIASLPKKSGYLTVSVPSISGNSFVINDDDGTSLTIPAVPENILYIPPDRLAYNFTPDYNALYTVLAGDSFLREGSQILFANPRLSSSLAVTTLLDTPYRQDAVLSLFPGGGFSISESEDSVLRAALVEKNAFPVIEWYDDVRNEQIAESVIHLKNPTLSLCSIEDEDDTSCSENLPGRAQIRLVNNTFADIATAQTVSSLSLLDTAGISLFRITSQGRIVASPLVDISLNSLESSKFLVFDLRSDGDLLGKLIIQTDKVSLSDSPNPYALQSENTIVTRIAARDMTAIPLSISTFGASEQGLRIGREEGIRELDTAKLGPTHTDSFGLLSEVPGVGWQGGNVSLLSFAAGDSVGTATRWSHTFTMVNLGDPVAHVRTDRTGTNTEGIDRSIGQKIASGVKGTIRQVVRKDMNNDGYEDIVVWYASGYAELILNLGDRMRSRGYILHVADLSERGIDGGDFTGDRFADMLHLDASGSLTILDNTNRKWSRETLRLVDGSVAPTGISQMKIFDMDGDKRDDIIYVSENGELAILYGTASPGLFDRSILDSKLGVEIDTTPTSEGGAIYASHLPEFPYGFTTPEERTSTNADALGPAMLQSQVYYQKIDTTEGGEAAQINSIEASLGSDSTLDPGAIYRDLTALSADISGDTPTTKHKTFVRSEYALGHNLVIEKTFRNTVRSTLYAGDPIEIRINIKNNTSRAIDNVEYLDTLPSFLSSKDVTAYRLTRNSDSETRALEFLPADQYDVRMTVGRMAPGETVTLTYTLRALPAAYGDMIVGYLEGGEVGDDRYGDVGFNTQTTCGADILLWRSTAVRSYEKGTRTFLTPEIPASITPYLTDADKNGVPDYVENMTIEDRTRKYDEMQKSDNRTDITPRATINGGNVAVDIGVEPATARNIEDFVQNLANGLSCGFGGGACMSFPLNYAPLAPGSSPSKFGMPTMPLSVNTGTPIFSAMTGRQLYSPNGTPYCVPSIFPATRSALTNFGGICGPQSAGGRFGTWDPKNKLRVYVTPTLTLGVGAAVCFGGPAIVKGNIPPPGVSPVTPGGNCIVVAEPMPFCKADGSKTDGDVAPFTGLGSMTKSWNAGSCTIRQSASSSAEKSSLTRDIVDYIRDPANTKLPGIYTKMSGVTMRGGGVGGGPVLRIGGDSSAGATGVEVAIDSRKPFTFGNIVKVKNKKVAAFPDFIMDWWSRQVEEMNNSLLSPPNIFIVPPRDFGPNAQFDGSLKRFSKKFFAAYSPANFQNFANSDPRKTTRKLTDQLRSANAKSGLGLSYQNTLNAALDRNSTTLNAVSGGANTMRAAYDFMGKLPFLKIERTTIAINVPWILPRDLDKYERRVKSYVAEVNETTRSWCANVPDKDACLNSKGTLQANAFVNSLRENLRIIEGYKKFPDKLQKYLTWKQRYLAQLLCNVDALEKMVRGWIKDNGRRFRAWVEFYILLKAILRSWQPLIDIFDKYKASCGVCRNERYDLKYFQFKLISAVMPTLPIIRFPRWPDIVLDLSDIRLAMTVRMPEFKLNISPIRLPELPNLSLPNGPNASLSLPSIPKLPPIPELPPLPDLPSLPTLTLPDLPPPPKLPKIFGSVSATLSILKLVSKVMCIYQKSSLVPEWRVGNVIAERTQRQGTLPIDFINLEFPQVSLGFLREIRVSSHVNFGLKTDFITEMAKAGVRPLNTFTTDMTRALPAKIGPNIEVTAPSNININVPRPGSYLPREDLLEVESVGGVGKLIARIADSIEKDASTHLSLEEFKAYMKTELLKISRTEFPEIYAQVDAASQVEDHSTEKLTEALLVYNTKKFSLFRDYMDRESSSLRDFQKIIDTLREPSERDLVLAEAIFTSRSGDEIREAEERFMSFQNSDTTSHVKTTTVDIDETVGAYADHMDRLIAATEDDASISSTSSETMPDGYAPSFQGIYIQRPSGEQTRLYDYIPDTSTDGEVDVVDIDRDGDEDYIFTLGNALYIKYSTRLAPSHRLDMSVTTSFEENMGIPTAPNYFREQSHESGYIDLSFTPARISQDSFRLEFYNRMLEWDMIASGFDTTGSRKTVMDFVVNEVDTRGVNADITKSPVASYISRIASRGKTIRLKTPNYYIHTAGDVFAITLGRPLYTGDSETRITYRIGEVTKSITLDPLGAYQFSAGTEVRIESGKAYIFDTVGDVTIDDPDTMRGMPLLPNMKIFTEMDDAVDVASTRDSRVESISDGSEYYLLSLGNRQEKYTVRIPYQNSWYYSRLYALGDEKNTIAGVTLLAPQAAADNNSPLIDLPDSIRIPVYTTQNIELRSIISEQSIYSISWDSDTSKDSSGNNITNDDMISSGTSSGVGIDNNSKTLLLGPFDRIGNRGMRLSVSDEFGNTSAKDVTLEIYAPIPSIGSASSMEVVIGAIDELIANEPIDLVRVREGSALTRFDAMTYTDGGGTFSGNILSGKMGVEVTSGSEKFLLDSGGLIDELPAGYTVVVDPASSSAPMKISVLDTSGRSVYSSYLMLPNSYTPRGVTLLTEATGSGIYIIPKLPNKWIAALPSDPFFAFGGYVTDSEGNAVVAIHRDGNIYNVADGVRLRYRRSDTGIIIMVEKDQQIVGEVVYNFDPFYTIR